MVGGSSFDHGLDSTLRVHLIVFGLATAIAFLRLPEQTGFAAPNLVFAALSGLMAAGAYWVSKLCHASLAAQEGKGVFWLLDRIVPVSIAILPALFPLLVERVASQSTTLLAGLVLAAFVGAADMRSHVTSFLAERYGVALSLDQAITGSSIVAAIYYATVHGVLGGFFFYYSPALRAVI